MLCWRAARRMAVPAALLRGPHMVGRAVPFVAPLMVGRAVLVPVHRGVCAWCGGAWLGSSLCVPPGGQRWVRVGGACGGVLAGGLRGLFCLFGVVFAALRSACSVGVVGGWVAVVVVLIAWPGWVLC